MELSRIYKDKDLSYYNHTRFELVDFIPANINTVLDIDCGTGNFGMMLKELNSCRVWGIEPDVNSFKQAESKLDYVINGAFDKEARNTINQKFDCIFFNDVLKHLAEPEEALL